MRGKFNHISVYCVLLLIYVLLIWGILIEPLWITVNPVTIYDSKLAGQWTGLKIVQISDLHIIHEGRRETLVLEKLSKIHPDIIVVTGDMAQWNSRPDGAVHFIERLNAPLGVYCVMGDADFSSRRYHCIFCHPGNNVHIIRHNPRLLRDEIISVSTGNGGKILIAGVSPGSDWGGEDNFPDALLEKEGAPVLVLDHFSEKWAAINAERPVLWLSGDTHGGQILMPGFFWKYIYKKPDPEHMAGLFHEGKHKWLYVNSGIGMTENIPVRIGVPPEITVFTFKEAK